MEEDGDRDAEVESRMRRTALAIGEQRREGSLFVIGRRDSRADSIISAAASSRRDSYESSASSGPATSKRMSLDDELRSFALHLTQISGKVAGGGGDNSNYVPPVTLSSSSAIVNQSQSQILGHAPQPPPKLPFPEKLARLSGGDSEGRSQAIPSIKHLLMPKVTSPVVVVSNPATMMMPRFSDQFSSNNGSVARLEMRKMKPPLHHESSNGGGSGSGSVVPSNSGMSHHHLYTSSSQTVKSMGYFNNPMIMNRMPPPPPILTNMVGRPHLASPGSSSSSPHNQIPLPSVIASNNPMTIIPRSSYQQQQQMPNRNMKTDEKRSATKTMNIDFLLNGNA